MGKNIRIRETGFAENLERHRLRKNLSKSDLAQAAGLSWRTIDNYVKGRFEYAQESALLRIAEALDVSLDTLLSSCEKRTPIYGRPPFLFAIIIIFAMVFGLALRACTDPGRIEIAGPILELPGGKIEFESNIVRWVQTDWEGREVIVIGKVGNAEEYGTIVAFDIETAESIWQHRPDYEALARVFPRRIVEEGDFYVHSLDLADLDGDGEKELVASVRHKMSYPCYLAVIDKTGRVESVYHTAGHINSVESYDMDGDHRDELYIAATNNSELYEGGTLIVLDHRHRQGAALDAETAGRMISDTSLPDSCKVRVVFPAFPAEFTNQLQTPRMDAFSLTLNGNRVSRDRLNLNLGQPSKSLIVAFDEDMHPYRAYPSDLLANLNDDWVSSGLLSRDWLSEEAIEAWLSGHRRFEAGHWQTDK